MSGNFSQMLAHATGGRRYCFVIMSYHEGYAFLNESSESSVRRRGSNVFGRMKSLVLVKTCVQRSTQPSRGQCS